MKISPLPDKIRLRLHVFGDLNFFPLQAVLREIPKPFAPFGPFGRGANLDQRFLVIIKSLLDV